MLRFPSVLTLALVAATLSSPGEAAVTGGTFRIQPTSHIGFHVGQAGGGGLDGVIGDVSGKVRIDAADLSRSAVTIDLKAASVTTGQGAIDGFLRSEAVFDAGRHPDIVFRSTRVVPTGERTARIEGTLTARGVSRRETFLAELTKEGGGAIAFHVVGDVYRSPYGMDVGTPIYSNVVRFDMALEARR